MERVLNQEMQPLPLDSGVVLPAAGTREAGPVDVELSARDRKLYVERGRLIILKPATKPADSGSQGTPSQPLVADKSGKAGK